MPPAGDEQAVALDDMTIDVLEAWMAHDLPVGLVAVVVPRHAQDSESGAGEGTIEREIVLLLQSEIPRRDHDAGALLAGIECDPLSSGDVVVEVGEAEDAESHEAAILSTSRTRGLGAAAPVARGGHPFGSSAPPGIGEGA